MLISKLPMLFLIKKKKIGSKKNFNADPDPAFYFTVLRIRIQLLFKVMENLRPLVHGLSRASFEPPGLYCEHPRPSAVLFWASKAFLNFDFNAYPNLAFNSNADPDPYPASKNIADLDPDQSFHFNADPDLDPAVYLNADPDPYLASKNNADIWIQLQIRNPG